MRAQRVEQLAVGTGGEAVTVTEMQQGFGHERAKANRKELRL
jgi:hypothetical protein